MQIKNNMARFDEKMDSLKDHHGSVSKGTLESVISDFTRTAPGDRLTFDENTEVLDALFKDKYVLPFDDVLAFLVPWKYDKHYGHGQAQTKHDKEHGFSPQVKYTDSLKTKIDAEMEKNTNKRIKLTVFQEMYDWEAKYNKDPVDAIFKNIKKGTELAKDLIKN